jgi:hypothetical protein
VAQPRSDKSNQQNARSDEQIAAATASLAPVKSELRRSALERSSPLRSLPGKFK